MELMLARLMESVDIHSKARYCGLVEFSKRSKSSSARTIHGSSWFRNATTLSIIVGTAEGLAVGTTEELLVETGDGLSRFDNMTPVTIPTTTSTMINNMHRRDLCDKP